MQTPEEYAEYILRKYLEARQNKISRLSTEWGVWSAEMNRKVRTLIELDDEESIWYKYVFFYWTGLSELLEMYYKKQNLFKRRRMLSITEEVKEIRRIIDTKDFTPKRVTREESNFMDLARHSIIDTLNK